MFSSRFLSIKQRLTLILMATSITVLLLCSFALFVNEIRSFKSSIVERVSALADLLSFNSVAALSFSDKRLANEILSSLNTAPHIVAATLYDNKNEVFATYNRDESNNHIVLIQLNQNEPIKFSGNFLFFSKPIEFQGDYLGGLFIQSDMSDLSQQLLRQISIFAGILLLGTVAAFVLSARLQSVISIPILNLARFISMISNTADYSQRIKNDRHDEIGILYSGFNSLLEQIDKKTQERDRALRELETTNKQLQESKEMRISAILNTAAEGIITLNEDSLIESFNRAAEATFGYKCKEVVGKSIALLLPEASNQDGSKPTLITGGTLHGTSAGTWGGEMSGKRKDGTLFPMELAMSVVKVADKNLYTLILRDITERKNIERELFQARKLEAIGQLAAGIAHEINTPIQYIGNNIAFLKQEFNNLFGLLFGYDKSLKLLSLGTLTPAEALQEFNRLNQKNDLDYLQAEIPRAVNEAQQGVERVGNIVRSMKEFSHPGTGVREFINLNKVIETTATVAQNEWRYIAELNLKLDSELPPVPCYPGDLNQAILNLLINAAHAIEEGGPKDENNLGRITVTTRKNKDQIEIRVSDTGCGIEESIQERMFNPFFTTKEVGKGTGQGLAIVHSIVVEKHKGSISWQTELGKGSTFVIKLPVSL